MTATTVPSTFHVLTKPTGAICNLDCKYCFFLSKEELYPNSKFRMTDETLERYIRQQCEDQPGPEVTIAWQGGEPTLMGLDFFRRSVELAEKYRRPGQAVQYTIQTNGTLLDEEWCAFLRENRFLVGLSTDGPRELHDVYRVDKGGHPTFDRVTRAARLMQQYQVDFNILCTVNAANQDGLQAGVQAFGYAMFLMTDAALDYLDRSDGWEVGVGPSVVIVDSGMARTLTTTTLQKDVYAFVFDQRGLMAGAGLQGSKITRINR
jgi:sulfatase maturation enzyme AslB (radical SAM superfamily)